MLKLHKPIVIEFFSFHLQKRNLSKKVDPNIGFGDFSYDKLYKYFELLGQKHDSELAELHKELEQLESEKSFVKVRLDSNLYKKGWFFL